MKKYLNNFLTSFIILGTFLLLAVSSGQDDKEDEVKERTKTEKPIIVSSTQLYEDYEGNEVGADNTYKDKVVQVTGKIFNISTNPIDDSELIVKLNGLVDNEYEIIGISCMFDESHSSEVGSLSKGDVITIKGICTGQLMGVNIEGCSLVK